MIEKAVASITLDEPPRAPRSATRAERAEWHQAYRRFLSENPPLVDYGGIGERSHSDIQILPLGQIAPNPEHPRDDWEVQDRELLALAASMRSCPFEQIEPLEVIPLQEGDPRLAEGHLVQILDGHRRFAAAPLAGLRELKVHVRLSRRHEAITPFDALWYWLISTTRKPPTLEQRVYAFARLYEEFERQNMGRDTPLPFPPRAQLAEAIGCSETTTWRVTAITQQPWALEVAQKRITPTVALYLIDRIEDPKERARAAARISREGQTQGQPLNRPQVAMLLAGTTLTTPAPKIATPQDRLQLLGLYDDLDAVQLLARLLRAATIVHESLGGKAHIPENTASVLEFLAHPATQVELESLCSWES